MGTGFALEIFYEQPKEFTDMVLLAASLEATAEVACHERFDLAGRMGFPMVGDRLELKEALKFPFSGVDIGRRPLARRMYDKKDCPSGVAKKCYKLISIVGRVRKKIDIPAGTTFQIERMNAQSANYHSETFVIRTSGYGEMELRCSDAQTFNHGEEQDERPCTNEDVAQMFHNISLANCQTAQSEQQTSSDANTVH